MSLHDKFLREVSENIEDVLIELIDAYHNGLGEYDTQRTPDWKLKELWDRAKLLTGE